MSQVIELRCSGEWNDLDFYLLKLKLDDIDGIGFWHYLGHPKQAWRDFWLWSRFSTLVKSKKPKRTKTKFKKEKPKQVTDAKELVTDEELKQHAGTKKERTHEEIEEDKKLFEELLKELDEKDKKE